MKVMLENEAEKFLYDNGLDIVQHNLVSGFDAGLVYARKIGFPVVLKIAGRLHKSDSGGVFADIRSDSELRVAYNKLAKLSKTVMVQKYVYGEELLIGIKADNVFGMVLVFGAGGIYTEIMKDVSFRICPVALKDVRLMIKETKVYNILRGYRNMKFCINKIERALIKLSNIAMKYSNITELDINPIIVNEKQAVIVDARIVFS
jgi:acyl-CoA synthetase (NDP forming)